MKLFLYSTLCSLSLIGCGRISQPQNDSSIYGSGGIGPSPSGYAFNVCAFLKHNSEAMSELKENEKVEISKLQSIVCANSPELPKYREDFRHEVCNRISLGADLFAVSNEKISQGFMLLGMECESALMQLTTR